MAMNGVNIIPSPLGTGNVLTSCYRVTGHIETATSMNIGTSVSHFPICNKILDKDKPTQEQRSQSFSSWLSGSIGPMESTQRISITSDNGVRFGRAVLKT